MKAIDRRWLIPASCGHNNLAPPGALAQPMRVKLYKDPNCPCCEGHAAYLDKNGFAVEIIPTADLLGKFAQAQVPSQLNGCHLIEMDGYVVIGHVPMEPIRKLLTERPKIIGLSIPGMPVGLPGMEGPRSGPSRSMKSLPEPELRVFS